jgi:hypothetical protein
MWQAHIIVTHNSNTVLLAVKVNGISLNCQVYLHIHILTVRFNGLTAGNNMARIFKQTPCNFSTYMNLTFFIYTITF